MIKAAITTVFFDLGDVVFFPDWVVINTQVIQKTGCSIFKPRTEVNYHALLNRGKLSVDEYFEVLRGTNSIEIMKFISAYEEAYLEFAPFDMRMRTILDTLRTKSLRLMCITDTNPLHRKLNMQKGIFDYFEKCYCSYETGNFKCDKGYFESILQENSLKPENCLFIDDSLKNIQRAEEAGLQTIHFKDVDSLRVALVRLNLL